MEHLIFTNPELYYIISYIPVLAICGTWGLAVYSAIIGLDKKFGGNNG